MSGGPPTHVPPEHVSLVVQALPSSHGRVLAACMQPVAGSHESVVQTFPSSQLRAGPPMQRPFEQASPSSHGAVFGVWMQPLFGSQESSVQGLSSSQSSGGPPTHVPAEQISAVVQALPSWHGFELKPTTWHVPVPLQVPSSVQT